jgi:hypothetical protein
LLLKLDLLDLLHHVLLGRRLLELRKEQPDLRIHVAASVAQVGDLHPDRQARERLRHDLGVMGQLGFEHLLSEFGERRVARDGVDEELRKEGIADARRQPLHVFQD